MLNVEHKSNTIIRPVTAVALLASLALAACQSKEEPVADSVSEPDVKLVAEKVPSVPLDADTGPIKESLSFDEKDIEKLKNLSDQLNLSEEIVTTKGKFRGYKTSVDGEKAETKMLTTLAEMLKSKGLISEYESGPKLKDQLATVLWEHGYDLDSSVEAITSAAYQLGFQIYKISESEEVEQLVPIGGNRAIKVTLEKRQRTERVFGVDLPYNDNLFRMTPAVTAQNPLTGEWEMLVNEEVCKKLSEKYNIDYDRFVNCMMANEAAHVAMGILFPNLASIDEREVINYRGKNYTYLQFEEAFSDYVSFQSGQSLEFMADRLNMVSANRYALSKQMFDDVMKVFVATAEENYKGEKGLPDFSKMSNEEICHLADRDPRVGDVIRLVMQMTYPTVLNKFFESLIPEEEPEKQ